MNVSLKKFEYPYKNRRIRQCIPAIACKYLGYSRDAFYRYKHLFSEGGEDALREMSIKKPNVRNRIEAHIEKSITYYDLIIYKWRPLIFLVIANELLPALKFLLVPYNRLYFTTFDIALNSSVPE